MIDTDALAVVRDQLVADEAAQKHERPLAKLRQRHPAWTLRYIEATGRYVGNRPEHGGRIFASAHYPDTLERELRNWDRSSRPPKTNNSREDDSSV
jgi:hypothetical protein